MSELQLINAVKAENVVAIKSFIEAGEDVNQQDEQGWTPLNWAAGKGNLDVVSLLVNGGADVFKVGRDLRTPYMIALAAGHVEVVKYLRQAEDDVEGEKPSRPERQYCKAYYLDDLRQFPNWSESKINWKEKTDPTEAGNENGADPIFSGNDVVFIHQDYTVTQSMWHDENVLFNRVTPEWRLFCSNTLEFKVPDDIDLIVSVEKADGRK